MMNNPRIYIYREYCDDCGFYEYLRVNKNIVTWQWTTNIKEASFFENIQEAKHFGREYTKAFDDNNFSYAYMDIAIVIKNYYSHDIVDEA